MMTRSYHYPLLDLVRYLAAFTVAICHYLSQHTLNVNYEYYSSISVEIFFVLSGFVLANQINHIIDRGFKIEDFKVFLIRRWMRTVPPYLLAVISAIIVFGGGTSLNILSYIFFVQNFFSDTPSYNFFSVGWSLSIEEWFYVTFPVILFIAYKNININNLNIIISLVIIFVSIFVRYFIGSQENWGEEVRRAVIFRADAIIFGYLAYLLKDYVSLKICLICSFFLFITFCLEIYLFSLNYNNVILQNLFFIICGIFFGFVIISLSKFTKLFGMEKIFSYFANLSYPMYLFHIIIIPYINFNTASINLLTFILVLHLFSLIFHLYFEKPILQLRPKYKM